MRSAPKTTSGRRRRTRSAKRTASARRCRRFMRLRIMSSPCWSERWRCGISRSSSAMARISVVVDLDRIDGGEAQALELRHMAEDGAHQPAELRAARQVGAPGGDVDAGQHHLGIAVLGQPAHLLDHGAGRHRARIAAAIGDDAEGAAVVAAVLHLDEGAGAAVEPVDQMAGGLLDRHDVVDADTWRLADAEVVALRLRASRHCRARGRPRAWRRRLAASIWAAQPETTMRASGSSRRALRIAWRAWRTASAVTAQVLTRMASPMPASSARRRMTSDSSAFSRQPKVMVRGADSPRRPWR